MKSAQLLTIAAVLVATAMFEPRRAVSSCIETPQGPLRVVATHLGLSIKEGREQVRELLRMAEEPARGVVLLGDFNDWFWPGSVRGVLCRELPGYSRHSVS